MKSIITFAALLAAALLTACEPAQDTERLGEASETLQMHRAMPLIWHVDPSDWRDDPGTGGLSRTSSCGTPEPALTSAMLELVGIPDGASVLAAILRIDPCDGHAVLPDNVPAMALWQFDRQGTVVQAMNGGADASLYAAAYDAPHDVIARPVPGTSFVIDGNLRTTLRFENEYGPGALGGMRISGVDVVWE